MRCIELAVIVVEVLCKRHGAGGAVRTKKYTLLGVLRMVGVYGT